MAHTLTRARYADLVAQHATRMMAQTEKETPRVEILKAQIEEIIARAQRAGVRFDDASVKSNPAARALKGELDNVVAAFQEYEQRTRDRLKSVKIYRAHLDALILRNEAYVTLSDHDAALLLDLSLT